VTAARKETEEVDDVSDPAVNGDAEPEVGSVEVAKPVEDSAPAAPAKKPLGTKEVIPFQWKLISESHGMTITLFKSVELPEVEAQMERIRNEGYYQNLRIVEAGMKIVQPKEYQMAKKREDAARKTAEKIAKKAAQRTAKATASRLKKSPKPAAKPAPPKHAAKKMTDAPAKKAPKKSTQKASAKTAKKKTASAKSPKKTTKATKARQKK